MRQGTRTLAKATAAYLACVAFAMVYLLSVSVGASWTTAVTRGVLCCAGVYFGGRLLLYPLADALVAAATEAEKKRREADE
ncbi:MAG: hypothetical protein ACE5F1_12755 [Planctomycetota bacterium]